MNLKIYAQSAVLCAAAFGCTLLTGCGTRENMTNAEAQRTTAVTSATATAATTARRTETTVRDHDNSLYEEDDVHRKTDVSEPDIIDRAESALDDAEDVVTSLLTEAKKDITATE